MASGAILAALADCIATVERVVAVFRVFGPADFERGDVEGWQIARGLRVADGRGDQVRELVAYEHERLRWLGKPPGVADCSINRTLVEPVGSVFHVDSQRRVQLVRAFHGVLDDRGHALQLFLGRLEHELVVDLQDHARPAALFLQPAVQRDHGHLDDVGRRALDRVVDGGTLGGLAHVVRLRRRGGGLEHREVAPPAQQRLDIALAARQRGRLLDVLLDARIGGEVTVHEVASLGRGSGPSVAPAQRP